MHIPLVSKMLKNAGYRFLDDSCMHHRLSQGCTCGQLEVSVTTETFHTANSFHTGMSSLTLCTHEPRTVLSPAAEVRHCIPLLLGHHVLMPCVPCTSVWELYCSQPAFTGLSPCQLYIALAYDDKRPSVPEGCPAPYR